ncbi:hypothetical protein DLM78_15220 [Leptospira stimsonii]|uniref:Uncharacterized protein n=1 Tax=Leptospira stimsonii TaxID=2202203 RepID=A0A8B3CMB7_9LEPT|nr:hypothetical protein DLM78_15220 [Leptospira stimsonii]
MSQFLFYVLVGVPTKRGSSFFLEDFSFSDMADFAIFSRHRSPPPKVRVGRSRFLGGVGVPTGGGFLSDEHFIFWTEILF